MAFGHVQGTAVSRTVGATTVTLTLGAAPTRGNLVVAVFQIEPTTITGFGIKDGNSNVYTLTPKSPFATTNPGPIQQFFAYLSPAPANATAAVTATWTGTSSYYTFWLEEFSVPNGQIAIFDADFTANNTTGGTAINTPTVTPSGIQGELLYAATAPNGTVSAPTAGGAAGVWTGAAGGIVGGNMAEYVLSATAGQAVNFTQAPSSSWNAMGMAFYLLNHNLAISGAGG
jgi:hypothetical protein